MKLICSCIGAIMAFAGTRLNNFNTYLYTFFNRRRHISARGLLVTGILPVAFLCFTALSSQALAQSRQDTGAVAGVGEIRPLRVGDKVPEEFWTREHLFYVDGDTVKISLEQYKGTPLILDFWASWCSACIYYFPKNLAFQTALEDRVQFVLVNSDLKYDHNLQTISRALMALDGEGEGTRSIIFDSYFKQLFPHTAIPHYVWIDHIQRVRAITTFDHLTLDQLRRFANIGKRGAQ